MLDHNGNILKIGDTNGEIYLQYAKYSGYKV